jgi:DNA recombination protein RmuC
MDGALVRMVEVVATSGLTGVVISGGAGILLGLLAGMLGAVAWQRSAHAVAATRLEEREREIARLAIAVEAERAETARVLAEATALREEQARLEAALESERRTLAALDEAQQRMSEAFKGLSAEALRVNNQSFLDLAKSQLSAQQDAASRDLEGRQTAIGELLKPIRESLAQVDGKLAAVEQARVGAYSALSEQVRSMVETQQRLQAETASLVGALKAPSVRGRWGEMQLRRVVEVAEMVSHCDFDEQPTARTAEGGQLRPDMVVRLPGGKNVVVDAKAPLAAYLEALDATDDATRELQLRAHARQVRDHMVRLGAKAYWDQFDPSPDFVVMFLPGESFFSAALRVDPALIELGVGQRVIPASPTTLIALLRAVAYGWRQEQVADNARAISELGRQLHDRLATLTSHFEKLGRSLNRAVSHYNGAVGSLEGRVIVAARRFKELGAASGSEMPELERIDEHARSLESGELFAITEARRR